MNPTPLPVKPLRVPPLGTVSGSAIFWRSDEKGWAHPPLYLTNPLLVMRVNREGTSVQTPEGEVIARHEDRTATPFKWIEEILSTLSDSSAGTERRLFITPSFPLVSLCATYEYGRMFNPHENCFRHAERSDVDDLFVGFHCTGFVRRQNQWAVVGRPPSKNARWQKWHPTAAQCEWPRPPGFHEGASTDRIPILAGLNFDYVPAQPSLERERYDEAVAIIKDHLSAGDIYQANLTVRFDGRAPISAERVFSAGIAAGGDRFAALVRGSKYYHVSFSPELLVKKWGRSIVTRPIKGTRPRPDDDGEIQRVQNELTHSPKDRAEHVMIVDLERNDLGRICEYGTVRVDPMMEPTVHPMVLHMESTVQGTLKANIGVREIFHALFPGGSVTGAPKKRALEIIGELENVPRGIYCGAMGWVDHRGDCELNLPIRTATIYDNFRIHYYAGGGIVADSTADEEWAELQQKARFIGDIIHELASK